jgi:hypothetical protein
MQIAKIDKVENGEFLKRIKLFLVQTLANFKTFNGNPY